MKCKYKTGEMSGLDCPCVNCGTIRGFLKEQEIDGKIYLSGTEEDKEKIRR